MKDTCLNCPDYASCTQICPKLEKALESLSKSSQEIPISALGGNIGKKDQKDGTTISVDDFLSIDPGRQFEDVEPQYVDFSQTSIAPRSIGPTEEDLKTIRRYIDQAIPSDKHKLKVRFLAFLRCDKMIAIARRAKVSKQNIHNQFNKIINIIHKKMAGYKENPKKTITPHQFKLKISK